MKYSITGAVVITCGLNHSTVMATKALCVMMKYRLLILAKCRILSRAIYPNHNAGVIVRSYSKIVAAKKCIFVSNESWEVEESIV